MVYFATVFLVTSLIKVYAEINQTADVQLTVTQTNPCSYMYIFL